MNLLILQTTIAHRITQTRFVNSSCDGSKQTRSYQCMQTAHKYNCDLKKIDCHLYFGIYLSEDLSCLCYLHTQWLHWSDAILKWQNKWNHNIIHYLKRKQRKWKWHVQKQTYVATAAAAAATLAAVTAHHYEIQHKCLGVCVYSLCFIGCTL